VLAQQPHAAGAAQVLEAAALDLQLVTKPPQRRVAAMLPFSGPAENSVYAIIARMPRLGLA
jgi:hypothetical protein